MSARRTRAVSSKGSAAAQRAMRQKLARDLGRVIAYVAPARASASSQSDDFPKFVADLIGGVFKAIVGGSIQQMQAYADLLRDVASSVDAFAHDNVAAARARDRLVERYPCLAVPKRRVAGRAARQQLLATMVLMGINRIVVTNGKISTAPAARKRSS
jgi:hypothetical protein